VAEQPSHLLVEPETQCPAGPFGRHRSPDPPAWLAPPPDKLSNRGCPVAAPPALDHPSIRKSAASLDCGAQRCAGDFYGYLFGAHPNLREMFPPMMHDQNERLFNALITIVTLMDRPDQLVSYLTKLGADHRKYGVRPEHYAPVGEALIQALRRHCTEWGEEIEKAWLDAYMLASDTMIAGAEGAEGPPFWRGRVVRHEMRTRDLAVLDIETDQPLPYEPGQYITVQTTKWPRVWRSFSVASAPSADGCHLQLHVRQIPGGWVSTALTRDLPAGGEVIIGPSLGEMSGETAENRDLLLVAGGVGLAPVRALAEDVLMRDESAVAGGWGMRRSVTLFHGARTPLELYDMPWLRELEKNYPWFSAIPVVDEGGSFHGLTGSVAEAALGYGDWSCREAYLAGPPRMIRKTAAGLRRDGTPEERVHYDEPGVS
jgi:NAD(P)H-flavin reductase/hemoglobin-like flavoprotein